MSARPMVYLAGPISGRTYTGAVHWRDYVTSLLRPQVHTLSPMRGKEYLAGKQPIGGTSEESLAFGQALSRPSAIVMRDRFDVMRCDAVLMNLLAADRVSIGTMIEAGWADAYRKPLVLVRHAFDDIHSHAMLDQLAGVIVPTLEEAVAILKSILA